MNETQNRKNDWQKKKKKSRAFKVVNKTKKRTIYAIRSKENVSISTAAENNKLKKIMNMTRNEQMGFCKIEPLKIIFFHENQQQEFEAHLPLL